MRRTKLMSGTGRGSDREIDPLGGIINIIDVFLVCMAGVLAMFVIYYNVDLNHPSVVKVKEGLDVQGVEDFENDSQKDDNGQYEKMGTVYVDKDSGNMYVIMDDEENEDNSNE